MAGIVADGGVYPWPCATCDRCLSGSWGRCLVLLQAFVPGCTIEEATRNRGVGAGHDDREVGAAGSGCEPWPRTQATCAVQTTPAGWFRPRACRLQWWSSVGARRLRAQSDHGSHQRLRGRPPV